MGRDRAPALPCYTDLRPDPVNFPRKRTANTYMADRISARVTVTGAAALLPAYRERVNELLDEDYPGTYRELHTGDRLEYDVRGRGGVPGREYGNFL